MRRLTSSFIASAMLIAGVNPAKADTTYLFNTTSNGYSTSTVEIFKAVTSSDGTSVDLTKITTLENSGLDDNSFWQDTSQNKLFFFNDTNDKIHAYDIDSDTWNNDVSFTSDSEELSEKFLFSILNSSLKEVNKNLLITYLTTQSPHH